MPIHLGKDSKGPFVQWGHQKKYHYKANDKQSLANAKSRAKKQMKAIFSSGYVGQSSFDKLYNIIMQQVNQNNIYYHISPYKFNQFLISKSGSGMSTSFWGYGIYFTKDKSVIQEYYNKMKDSFQHLYSYTIKINCRTISDVLKNYKENYIPQNKNQKLIYAEDDLLADDKTVGQIYYELAQQYGQQLASQKILNDYNVAGIQYYTQQDGNSLVVYDQTIIQILNIQEVNNKLKFDILYQEILNDLNLQLIPADLNNQKELEQIKEGMCLTAGASSGHECKPDDIIQKFQWMLAQTNHYFYFIQNDLNKIGFLHISKEDNYIDINDFAIFKDFQGNGLSTPALNTCINFIKNNYPQLEIHLCVAKINEIALNLYQKCGFTIYKYPEENASYKCYRLKLTP